MKKILLLNGSPRGEKSNSLKLARAFCRGAEADGGCVTEEITLAEKKIGHCKGCFSCWTKTPGRCVIKDDMEDMLQSYIEADTILWSFPLYYFSMPSLVKAFMDRLLPLNEPGINILEDGTPTHPNRYDLSHQRNVLISTCGFPSRHNVFEALEKQFDILGGDAGSGNETIKILCPEGELFSIPALKGRTDGYLSHVKEAGEEYARDGNLTGSTRDALSKLLYPVDAFLEMANASWDIAADEDGGEKTDNRPERFLRQMAAIYNPSAWKQDIVLEMCFTDPDQTFQLHLGKTKCSLVTDDFSPATTRIETPFSTWLAISNGELDGARAMMDGLYRVTGEFDTMNHMDALFGTARETSDAASRSRNEKQGRTSMNFLLFPWIALWVLLPMGPLAHWGGFAAIALGALVTLAGFRFALTPYDRITVVLVTALGLPPLLGIAPFWLISLSYLLFGLMWTLSARREIPLTAWYSSGKHGGDSARANPLFIKTNRILTDCWGILYLLIALISFFMMRSPLKPYTGIICQAGPIVMGIFTAWFQKWYPPYVAGGRK